MVPHFRSRFGYVFPDLDMFLSNEIQLDSEGFGQTFEKLLSKPVLEGPNGPFPLGSPSFEMGGEAPQRPHELPQIGF